MLHAQNMRIASFCHLSPLFRPRTDTVTNSICLRQPPIDHTNFRLTCVDPEDPPAPDDIVAEHELDEAKSPPRTFD